MWTWRAIPILSSFLIACGGGPSSEIDVVFLDQPQGGDLVQTLTSRFRVTIDPAGATVAEGQIELTVQWMTGAGAHQTETVGAPWALAEPNPDVAEYTTSFSAPAGLYLDKTFWVRVEWYDHGDLYYQESAKAACTLP